MRKITYIITWFSVLALTLYCAEARAVELRLESQKAEFAAESIWQIDVVLDAAGSHINAVEGKIIFPQELFELQEIRDGSSVIPLWITRPHVQDGAIVFAGVIPGGFEGMLQPFSQEKGPGSVFQVLFRSKVEGEGILELQDVQVLLHDGLGTAADVGVSSLAVRVQGPEVLAASEKEPEEDTDPPEPFEPVVTRDPAMFDNKYVVIFAAQDKQSGIARYEVAESSVLAEKNESYGSLPWVEATSPHLLQDQGRTSYVYVKAVDNAGNERIEVVPPHRQSRQYRNYIIGSIVVVSFMIVYKAVQPYAHKTGRNKQL